VVELLHGKSDGVPSYSNAPFGYVAATSFRGEFLESCTAFLDQTTIDLAWRNVIPPSEAVVYGRLLLAALDRPAADLPPPGASQPGTLVPTELSVQEQRQVIDEAGRWYVFWGQRGNPVWANF